MSHLSSAEPASTAPHHFYNDSHNNSHGPPADFHHVDNPMPHLLSEGENATPLEVIGSTATDKLVISLDHHQVQVRPTPIHRFVVLDECDRDSVDIRLSVLSGNESLNQLLGSTFNARLVTPERLRRQFLAAREWASRVVVQRLRYPRVLATIDQVRQAIVSDLRSASMRV